MRHTRLRSWQELDLGKLLLKGGRILNLLGLGEWKLYLGTSLQQYLEDPGSYNHDREAQLLLLNLMSIGRATDLV